MFFYQIEVTRDDKPFLDAIKESPASVLVAIICFFSVWSVLGLAGFHTYLTTSNQTTNEDVRTVFFNIQSCVHIFFSGFYVEFNSGMIPSLRISLMPSFYLRSLEGKTFFRKAT